MSASGLLPSAYLTIHSPADVDRYMGIVREAAFKVHSWLFAFAAEPLALLRAMKFEPVGFGPVDHAPLNIIEQVNQTWTYAVALEATRVLLDLHPNAEGFHVAPGAHMAIPLDIMSVRDGLVGAETFAAVDPRNNRKIYRDVAKMARRIEQHRYVFFVSPTFRAGRCCKFETGGVEVHSIDISSLSPPHSGAAPSAA